MSSKPVADSFVIDNPISRVAAAVIHRAVADMRGPSPRHRTSAERFFDDVLSLAAWCFVAGIRPEVVMQRLAGKLKT